MQSPPLMHLPDFAPEIGTADFERALRISATMMAISSHYEDLLISEVFPHPMPGYDEKALRSHKKCLRDEEARDVLAIVWKESSYLPDAAFDRLPFGRDFQHNTLTPWSLATALCSTAAADLAKKNSRIRQIGIAAEAYGLMQRKNDKPTHRPMQGTEKLHSFMMMLWDANHRAMSELISALSPSDPIFDLSKQ